MHSRAVVQHMAGTEVGLTPVPSLNPCPFSTVTNGNLTIVSRASSLNRPDSLHRWTKVMFPT